MPRTPIKQFNGLRVRIAQVFGVNGQVYSQFKDAFGNPLKGHNGVDLCIGADPRQMYGADLNSVCDGSVVYITGDSPMSTKGNGVYIDTPVYIGSDGKQRFDRWIYWHLMKVGVTIGQDIKEGQYIGDMGNSGWVNPVPNTSNPYGGTHLHLGKYPFVLNTNWEYEFASNGFGGATDPLPFLGDLNLPGWTRKNNVLEWIGELLEPIRWFIQKIQDAIKK